MTWNGTGMEGRSCSSCELWCKEAEKNSRTIKTLMKRVANDDFQQDWCSGNIPFSVIYRKTTGRNLHERQEFRAAPLPG
ncbi:hypothetical protein TNCV_4875091 [Trichonephila clavipes]|nr:hypothetical protein TNCV_4875091 [Trichonephila clavipes]